MYIIYAGCRTNETAINGNVRQNNAHKASSSSQHESNSCCEMVIYSLWIELSHHTGMFVASIHRME